MTTVSSCTDEKYFPILGVGSKQQLNCQFAAVQAAAHAQLDKLRIGNPGDSLCYDVHIAPLKNFQGPDTTLSKIERLITQPRRAPSIPSYEQVARMVGERSESRPWSPNPFREKWMQTLAICSESELEGRIRSTVEADRGQDFQGVFIDLKDPVVKTKPREIHILGDAASGTVKTASLANRPTLFFRTVHLVRGLEEPTSNVLAALNPLPNDFTLCYKNRPLQIPPVVRQRILHFLKQDKQDPLWRCSQFAMACKGLNVSNLICNSRSPLVWEERSQHQDRIWWMKSKVPVNEWRSGDLIFLSYPPRGIYVGGAHVMVYLGEGFLIGKNGTDGPLEITSLDQLYHDRNIRMYKLVSLGELITKPH